MNIDIQLLDGEIWLPAKGHEDNFFVSTHGRLISLERTWAARGGVGKITIREKLLKSGKKNTGYTRITTNSKQNKAIGLHRMIAMTFLINPENKPFINHKNGIKNDNKLSNLEWCTQKENVRHSLNTGLQIPKKGRINELSGMSKEVLCINSGIKYPSAEQAARSLKMHSSHIRAVCLGTRKTANGLMFKYTKND